MSLKYTQLAWEQKRITPLARIVLLVIADNTADHRGLVSTPARICRAAQIRRSQFDKAIANLARANAIKTTCLPQDGGDTVHSFVMMEDL